MLETVQIVALQPVQPLPQMYQVHLHFKSPEVILSFKKRLWQPHHACNLRALHITCSVDAIMSCNHYLALERLGVVGCLYNTSILSRRPIAAIIPPPNPTTLTPASLSSQLLISLTTKMQFVLFCWLNCSGEVPSGLTASGSGSGEVKSEQPDDFLNDLLAQLDPPPGPSWELRRSYLLTRTFPIEWDLKLHAILKIMK